MVIYTSAHTSHSHTYISKSSQNTTFTIQPLQEKRTYTAYVMNGAYSSPHGQSSINLVFRRQHSTGSQCMILLKYIASRLVPFMFNFFPFFHSQVRTYYSHDICLLCTNYSNVNEPTIVYTWKCVSAQESPSDSGTALEVPGVWVIIGQLRLMMKGPGSWASKIVFKTLIGVHSTMHLMHPN